MFRLRIPSSSRHIAARSIAIEGLRSAERIGFGTDVPVPIFCSRRLPRYDPVQPAHQIGEAILLQKRDLRMFDQEGS